MRKCKYRNCLKEITGRPNKLFCNRKCKCNEQTYIKRKKKFIEKYSRQEMKNVELVKFIQNIK